MWADEVSALRAKLPTASDKDKIQIYFRLYQLSLVSGDVPQQISCLNDAIAETRRQHNNEKLADVLVERIQYFYNRAMADSVIKYAPLDKQVLADIGQWDKYYELWTHLVNTYIYYGDNKNKSLQEVQAMFDDALKRDNKYGQGIAYYVMGNVYLNMNNLDECVVAYQKGLDILLSLSPLPVAIPDLYSYYGDVLNERKEFQLLDSLTVSWMSFIPQFISDHKLGNNKSQTDILWFYYDIACAQAALGLKRLDRASQMLEDSSSHFEAEESYQGMAWLYCKAQLSLCQGNFAEALDYNTRRLRLTPAEEDRAVYITVISQRADILSCLARYKEAAGLYREMYLLKDSISSADTKKQLNEMNTLFHVGELEREQERTQFRAIISIIVLVTLALLVFVVFRMRAAKRLKKAHDELLVAYDQLEETTTAKERIESDLRIARNIQMGMVPSKFPDRTDLDLFASMTPAKEVGGDLYGYLLVEADGVKNTADKLYFALGDVSGKGVPASLFMAQATRLFRTLAAQGMKPADIAIQINDALSGEDNETGMFVTMFIGLLDLSTGHLDFCNAGHNPPVLVSDGKAEFIEMIPNCPIGLWPGFEYEGEEIADISDRPLFVYTDGLNEAENRQQEQFSDERLVEMLQAVPFESSQKTISMLAEAVEKHRDGADPNDDLTMLCVKLVKSTKLVENTDVNDTK